MLVSGFEAGAQLITTVVGGGYATGQSALNIGTGPQGMALDAAGNLYVADISNSRIYKMDTLGIITDIAGCGIYGNSGDLGPAINAYLEHPNDVAIDLYGNVFFSDIADNKIRKIDTNGIINTYAGTGVAGYSGDTGPATLAQLYQPACLMVDTLGNVLFADELNNVVRKIDAMGIITTIAGTGTAGYTNDGHPATTAELNYPTCVRQDKIGNLIIVDYGNKRIRKIDGAGVITTIAGGGTLSGNNVPATAASIDYPLVASKDTNGRIYFSEYGLNRVRVIDTNGYVTTIAGDGLPGFAGDGGPATSAKLRSPVGVTADKRGNVYIADYIPAGEPNTNCRVRKVDASGVITTIAGNGTTKFGGNGDPAPAAQVYNPNVVAVDNNGNIYVTDSNVMVRRANSSGIITAWAGSHAGVYPGDGGPATAARFENIRAMVTDAAGNLYIADGLRVHKIDSLGNMTLIAGGGTGSDGSPATAAHLFAPTGIAIDHYGNLYIADNGANKVRKVDTSGIITTIAGTGLGGNFGNGGPATNARLTAYGVAVDDSGRVFVSDNGLRIRCIGTNDTITLYAGSGNSSILGDTGPATAAYLSAPRGIATDHEGNLYVADYNNSRVRKISSTGIITTAAGMGIPYYYGDGMDVFYSELDGPADVKIDPAGNLLIADSYNLRIRKVWLNTGLREVIKDNDPTMTVYPNPTNGRLTIELGAGVQPQYVVITDMAGNERMQQRINTTANTKLEIDLTTLPTGDYLLHLVCSGRVVAKKIVVER